MAAAGKWKLYEAAKLKIAQGLIDLDSHAFKVGLFLSTSNANDLTLTNAYLADLTNQVATAFGYTQSTKAVALTVARAAGTVTVDETTNPSWTAAGGSITARFAVIYDDTNANKDALCVCLLDTTPADVSATDTNPFTITNDVAGIFTLSGAAVD